MRTRNSTLIVFVICLFIILNYSCKKNTHETIFLIKILSGNNQYGQTGINLNELIEIKVEDQYGNPIKNATVLFTCEDGYATPSDTFSNSEGIVRTKWTLGNSVGKQSLSVQVFIDGIEKAYTNVFAKSFGYYFDSRDGQYYKIIFAGNRVWFAENLNYQTGGSVCYDNNPDNGEIYGKLYSYEDALLACPEGWHLPKISDFEEMINEYKDIAKNISGGGSLKEIGTTHWKSPNTGATNLSDFTALPAGNCINTNGAFDFYRLGEGAYFWVEKDFDFRWVFLKFDSEVWGNGSAPESTFNYFNSVRYVKD